VNLDAWLSYIQDLHPRDIELGLARVKKVANQLGLTRPARHIISVAGTNGKGSCVAFLETLLQAHDFRVGAYTSPHIQRFNERICIAGKQCTDAELVDAFSCIEVARQSIPLTFFEFSTLAALQIFEASNLDVVILEVGLGGRLDAVNIVDADIVAITSIALDHTDWLGNNLESIGREKAGILRQQKPVVIGQAEMPGSVLDVAAELSSPIYQFGSEFGCQLQEDKRWTCWVTAGDGTRWQIKNVDEPSLQINYAVSALQILSIMNVSLSSEVVRRAVSQCRLVGRFEWIKSKPNEPRILLDVAHNTAAASLLSQRLLPYLESLQGRVHIVLAIMADKDTQGFLQALDSIVDIWYIAQVDQQRCLPAQQLARSITKLDANNAIFIFDNVSAAFLSACKSASGNDLILVTGSFYTVAEVHQIVSEGCPQPD